MTAPNQNRAVEIANYFEQDGKWIVRVVGRGFAGDTRRTTTWYVTDFEHQAKMLCWYLTGTVTKVRGAQ